MTDCVVQTTPMAGEFTATGLRNGGKLTKVTLSAVTWTALPPTPLAGRNALSIQNTSATQIVIDYVDTNPLYEGVILNSSAERFYSITDQITIYAKAQAGTPTIMIEEIG